MNLAEAFEKIHPTCKEVFLAYFDRRVKEYNLDCYTPGSPSYDDVGEEEFIDQGSFFDTSYGVLIRDAMQEGRHKQAVEYFYRAQSCREYDSSEPDYWQAAHERLNERVFAVARLASMPLSTWAWNDWTILRLARAARDDAGYAILIDAVLESGLGNTQMGSLFVLHRFLDPTVLSSGYVEDAVAFLKHLADVAIPEPRPRAKKPRKKKGVSE